MNSISSLLVFSTRGALKYQTNIEAHPPGCLRANQSGAEQLGEELEQGEDEERRCREEAHFQPHYPQVCVGVCVSVCYVCFGISIYLKACLFVFVSVCLCCRGCGVFGKCWRELALFIRGEVLLGRGRHPLSTSRPVFCCVLPSACVITCLHMVVKQRAGSIKSPLNLIVLRGLYGSCEQLVCDR